MLIVCVVFPLWMSAQQAYYNKKGDDSMNRQDYSDAKMWYEEGVSQCDSYSIQRLTTIWKNNAGMRLSMRSLMNKCLNCLNVKATEKDTAAVAQLITYYKEGIGTPKNQELAAYWSNQLKKLRNTDSPTDSYVSSRRAPAEALRFFVGYSFSPAAPFGLLVGAVGGRLGGFVRLKTNMSFLNYDEGKAIADYTKNASYEYIDKRANNFAGTAGLVIKCTPWLYSTVGLGYGKHDLIYKYRTYAYDDINKVTDVWCKQESDSFQGVAADLDFMVRLGSMMFVSAGCSTLNFKYVDLNAGFGIFF